MDPLGDYTYSDGRGLPSPVEDEFPNPNDEEINNLPVLRSVQIFLNDSLSDNRSPSILQNSLSEKETNEEDPLSTDPLNFEIDYADIKPDEVKGDSMYEMEGGLGEGCGEVVIKQEPEWEAEEIDIVDDHLDNLSDCPRKRIRELEILLRKETEDHFEGNGSEGNNVDGNENRYSLRQEEVASTSCDVFKKRSRNLCSFTGCGRNKFRYPTLHFFTFPVKRPSICDAWVKNCSNEALYKVTKKTLNSRVVCEKHFDDNSFLSTLKTRLHSCAIPTILSLQDHE